MSQNETMQALSLNLRKTESGWQYLSEGVGTDPDTWCDATSALSPFSGSGVNSLLDELAAAKQAANPENPAAAAVEFALSTEDSLQFLRLWNEGQFDVIRQEWPDAPPDVFAGADQYHKPTVRYVFSRNKPK